jgi:hypothetical protein
VISAEISFNSAEEPLKRRDIRYRMRARSVKNPATGFFTGSGVRKRRVRAFSQQSRGAIVDGFRNQSGESAVRGRLRFIQWRANSGMGAGNVGLPGYQVAMGFAEGSNAVEARDFANRVLTRLRQHRGIEVVPAGAGAGPMAGCR